MALIPTGVKIGAIVLLIALVTGGYFAWAHHQQALGAAAVNLKNAQAIIAQREEDAKENAKAVAQLAQKLQDTETKVITVTERIYSAQKTTVCPEQPAIRAAIDGVRDIYADPIQTPDRRRPAPAVPASGPPAKLSK
jgi:septal ring factor EnvC (AmiA/AmiB activator)